MTRIFAVVLSTLLLAGCASTPRAMLDDGGYESYANSYVGLNSCGSSGKMSPDVAARGLAQIKTNINQYAYYPQRLAVFVENAQRDNEPGTQEQCNQLAMAIYGRKQQIDNQNQAYQADQAELNRVLNNRTMQTYCNRVGTQTLCTTY